MADDRQLREMLAASEQRYSELLGAVSDYTYTVEIQDGQPVSTAHSPGSRTVTGYSPKEYRADPLLWYTMIYEEDREVVSEFIDKLLEGTQPSPLEHRIVHKDGSVRWIKNTPVLRFDGEKGLVAYDSLVSDINSRKRAELDESHLRRRLEAMWDIVQLRDADLHTITTALLDKILEMTNSQFGFYGVVDEDKDQFVVDAWSEKAMENCQVDDKTKVFPLHGAGLWAEALRQRRSVRLNDYQGAQPGKRGLPQGHVPIRNLLVFPVFLGDRIVSLGALANKDGGYSEKDENDLSCFLNNIQILVDQKRGEEALAKVNRALRVLNSANSVMIKVEDESELLTKVCRILVETGGYDFAWVGIPEQDEEKTVKAVAWAGPHEEYLNKITITWGETEYEHGASGSAIMTGKRVVCRDIQANPSASPWQESAANQSFVASIALPLISEPTVLGILNVYSSQKDAFVGQEVDLLEELANNLAFGTEALRTRLAREKAEHTVFQQNSQLEAIGEVFKTAISSSSDKELGRKCLAIAETLTASKFGFICETNDKGLLDTLAISNPGWAACTIPVSDARRHLSDLPIHGVDRATVRTGESRIINGEEAFKKHPDHIQPPEGHPALTAFLGVPLRQGDEIIGMIGLANKEGGYKQADQDTIEQLGPTIVEVLRHYRLEAQIKKQTNEMLALTNSSLTLTTLPLSADIYQKICDLAVQEFSLRMAWVGLVEEGSYAINPVARAGHGTEYLATAKCTWDDSAEAMGPCGMSIKERRPCLMRTGDPAFKPWREMAQEYGFAAVLGVPLLKEKGGCFGTIVLYSSTGDFFTDEKVRVVQQLASQASLRIENRALITGLEEKVKQRTGELETMTLDAVSASKAKSDFLANMSHELRTPLNSILGFSELLLSGLAGEATEDQKEYLTDIQESGTHLLSLINDILDLSKVEAGKMELESDTLDMPQVLSSCLSMFREKAMQHGIELQNTTGADVDQIMADERKVKQVVFNLLSNAFKFTPDRGRVGLDCRKTGEGLQVEVWDSGIGISREDQGKLFQPFTQIGDTLTKNYEGTGLGLALSWKIVEMHGGRIWVESEPGKGSRFFFVIPSSREKES